MQSNHIKLIIIIIINTLMQFQLYLSGPQNIVICNQKLTEYNTRNDKAIQINAQTEPSRADPSSTETNTIEP